MYRTNQEENLYQKKIKKKIYTRKNQEENLYQKKSGRKFIPEKIRKKIYTSIYYKSLNIT